MTYTIQDFIDAGGFTIEELDIRGGKTYRFICFDATNMFITDSEFGKGKFKVINPMSVLYQLSRDYQFISVEIVGKLTLELGVQKIILQSDSM